MAKPVILLEFNEICPPLLSQFMAHGLLPNFSRFYENSESWVTHAGEEPPNLEPWIQWATVHTGAAYSEHGLFNLDEGHRLPNEQIWSQLSDAGKKVWVCGSMNVGHSGNVNGFILPDPWARNVAPHPPGEFEHFLNFVRDNVLEHTNANASSSSAAALRFATFMLSKGFSLDLAKQVVSQLFQERTTGKFRWQRASILDSIQWNVFKHYWHKHQPDFATLFLNSVAHYQHVYWRYMTPELFSGEPTTAEQAEFGKAILFGYQQFDRILGECLNMVEPGTQVALVSALSQRPCTKYEESGGKRCYRPNDFAQITGLAGIEASYDCTPVMTEEFLLRFTDAQTALDAKVKLEGLKVDGQRAMSVRQDEEELMVGCGIYTDLNTSAKIVNGLAGNEGFPFFDAFYQIAELKSGEHDPQGVFWLWHSGGEQIEHAEQLALTDVAPRIYELAGVPFRRTFKDVA